MDIKDGGERTRFDTGAVRDMHTGKGVWIYSDYFRDGVGYLKAAEAKIDEPTLFDFLAATND